MRNSYKKPEKTIQQNAKNKRSLHQIPSLVLQISLVKYAQVEEPADSLSFHHYGCEVSFLRS